MKWFEFVPGSPKTNAIANYGWKGKSFHGSTQRHDNSGRNYMNPLKTIKQIAGTSVLVLSANLACAQWIPLTGDISRPGCSSASASGNINIDRNYTDPSPTLGYLFAINISTAGYSSCDGRYYAGTWTNTAFYTVDETWPMGIEALPPSELPLWNDPTEEHPNGTWSVVYRWGDPFPDSSAASSFSGIYTGGFNNPGWDQVELTVELDAGDFTFITALLRAHESILAYEMLFSLHP